MGLSSMHRFMVSDLCTDLHEDLRLALNVLDFVVNRESTQYTDKRVHNARALLESAQAKVLHIKSLQ